MATDHTAQTPQSEPPTASRPDTLRASVAGAISFLRGGPANPTHYLALADRLQEALDVQLAALTGASEAPLPAKTPERWARACRVTVELIGRVNRGAELDIEIAEALVNFGASEAPPTQEG